MQSYENRKRKDHWLDVIFAEPRDTGKYSCSLVDLNVVSVVGLFGNEMLRPEAAPQEVDNRAEVFTCRPGVALQRCSRRRSLRQRRCTQRLGATCGSSEKRRRDPHGRQKSGMSMKLTFAP